MTLCDVISISGGKHISRLHLCHLRQQIFSAITFKAVPAGVQNMCQRVSTADRHFFLFCQALFMRDPKWPKNDPKWPKNDQKWPKNDPKWQKITQNYPKWPKNDLKWTKITPKWPKSDART